MNDTTEIKLHFLDYWRVIKVRWAILTTAFLLVMITAGLTCYFVPREYFSKVTMQVKSDETGFKIFSQRDGIDSGHDVQLTPTQYQIIQRKEILYPVIENLKLCDTWAPVPGQKLAREEAYNQLLYNLDIKEVRNTDLLEIGFYSTDRQEAANVANMIAVVYQEKRKGDQMAVMNQGLGQLDEEVIKQRKAVEIAQAEATKIRMDQHIIDLNPEVIEAAADTTDMALKQDQQQYNDALIKITELRTQLEQTEKLTPDQLMQSLHALNIDDPTVSKILPLYQDSNADEARMLNSGYGENHPKLKALRAQKAVYSQTLKDQIGALRNSFATRLKVAEATAAALKEKMSSGRDQYQASRAQNAEYIAAKTKYINAKRVLDSAENRLVTEKMQVQMSIIPAKIWEKAEPSLKPARPDVAKYMLLAVVIGLVVGVGLAFFIEYLDTSVKTLEDVERFLAVPVLAVIPKGVGSLLQNTGDSPDAEAYRILQTNLEFNRKNPHANTITLVSGGPGEGKSTTLNNLAYTCAKGGYRVLVIDADLRRPSQHVIFGVENNVGLTDFLTGERTFESIIQSTALPNLYFVPSGKLTTDAVGVLNSQGMSDLIAKVKEQYDLVFFDSPPILGVSDASILASAVDITIMVVQYRRFPRDMIKRVKQAIVQVGGNLMGAVLNFVDTKHDSGYQYYTQYYDYYSAGPGGSKPNKTHKPQATSPAAKGSDARSERSNPTHGDY